MKNEGLKLVIAVRHGEYTDLGDKGLDDKGRRQSQILAQKLRLIIPVEYSIEIFSSPATRAEETAEILAFHLKSKTESLDELRTEKFDDGEIKRRAILRSTKGSNVIVAVTHYTSPSGIIHAFSQYHFRQKVNHQESPKGNGIMIDLLTGGVVANLLVHTV